MSQLSAAGLLPTSPSHHARPAWRPGDDRKRIMASAEPLLAADGAGPVVGEGAEVVVAGAAAEAQGFGGLRPVVGRRSIIKLAGGAVGSR